MSTLSTMASVPSKRLLQYRTLCEHYKINDVDPVPWENDVTKLNQTNMNILNSLIGNVGYQVFGNSEPATIGQKVYCLMNKCFGDQRTTIYTTANPTNFNISYTSTDNMFNRLLHASKTLFNASVSNTTCQSDAECVYNWGYLDNIYICDGIWEPDTDHATHKFTAVELKRNLTYYNGLFNLSPTAGGMQGLVPHLATRINELSYIVSNHKQLYTENSIYCSDYEPVMQWDAYGIVSKGMKVEVSPFSESNSNSVITFGSASGTDYVFVPGQSGIINSTFSALDAKITKLTSMLAIEDLKYSNYTVTLTPSSSEVEVGTARNTIGITLGFTDAKYKYSATGSGTNIVIENKPVSAGLRCSIAPDTFQSQGGNELILAGSDNKQVVTVTLQGTKDPYNRLGVTVDSQAYVKSGQSQQSSMTVKVTGRYRKGAIALPDSLTGEQSELLQSIQNITDNEGDFSEELLTTLLDAGTSRLHSSLSTNNTLSAPVGTKYIIFIVPSTETVDKLTIRNAGSNYQDRWDTQQTMRKTFTCKTYRGTTSPVTYRLIMRTLSDPLRITDTFKLGNS